MHSECYYMDISQARNNIDHIWRVRKAFGLEGTLQLMEERALEVLTRNNLPPEEKRYLAFEFYRRILRYFPKSDAAWTYLQNFEAGKAKR